MDKKVLIKDIDKILKYNKHKTKTITYKCGADNVEITIDPCAGYIGWTEAISAAMTLVFTEDSLYFPSMCSIAYRYALIYCFTNIKADNSSKVIEIAMQTDLCDKIESNIPEKTLLSFKSDFERSLEKATLQFRSQNSITDVFGILGSVLNETISDVEGDTDDKKD